MASQKLKTVAVAGAVVSLAAGADPPARPSAPPGDSEIKAALHQRVGPAGPIPGIVVGILDQSGSRIFSAGKLGRPNQRAADGDTVFEIGSITKVFTALLLSDMTGRGEIKLDDPISIYLPKSVKVPERNGRAITLLDLATHTSGLPRMPDNFAPKDPENPYADYTVGQMYDFLSHYALTRDIGAEYEYSNIGAGLLGHILALKAGTNYEALVLQRICRPLGMTNTQIALSPDLKARLATGHNSAGQPVANWDIPALSGAGALRSTANDLLKFLAANLNPPKSNLGAAMQLTHQARHRAGSPDMDIGLCWHISKRYGASLVWHNGGTGGYHSFVGFDPQKKRAVVVLANSARSIDDLGFHFLDAAYPLAGVQPSKDRVAIALSPQVLDRYIGRYELAPGVFFILRRENDRLMAQLTGQSFLELFPESETEFFYKAVEAQITFVKDSQGRVTRLVLHQNGRDQNARKLEQP
jgi:CubicO group peptidase (beta-lactamase class C family)